MFMLENKLDDKLERLIKKQEKRLGVYVIEVKESKNNDVHVLAKREADGMYCVWTAINTGEYKTSYEAFYGGTYTTELMEAINEFKSRVQGVKEQKIIAIIDSDGDFPVHYYYDVTSIEGELKDYHEFENYDEFESYMIKKGAIPIEISEYKI